MGQGQVDDGRLRRRQAGRELVQSGACLWLAFDGGDSSLDADVRRREFVRYLALLGGMAALDPERLASTLRGAVQLDRTLVEQLRSWTRRLAGQWSTLPPAVLRPHVDAHLRAALELLAGPLPAGLRRDLMAVAPTLSSWPVWSRAWTATTIRRVTTFIWRTGWPPAPTRPGWRRWPWCGWPTRSAACSVAASRWSRSVTSSRCSAEPRTWPGRQHPALCALRSCCGRPRNTAIDLGRYDDEQDMYGLGWQRDLLHRAFRGNVELLAGNASTAVGTSYGA